MARSKTISRAMTAAWSLVIGFAATLAWIVPVSTGQSTALIDLATVSPCGYEDGPALGGPVPCVWDAETRGVPNAPDYVGARWIYYAADDRCPVATVQSAETVHCVMWTDWSGQ